MPKNESLNLEDGYEGDDAMDEGVVGAVLLPVLAALLC